MDSKVTATPKTVYILYDTEQGIVNSFYAYETREAAEEAFAKHAEEIKSLSHDEYEEFTLDCGYPYHFHKEVYSDCYAVVLEEVDLK